MSIGWLIVLLLAVLFAFLLFIPFYFIVDSQGKRVSVRWVFLSVAFRFSDKSLEIRLAGLRFQKKPAAPSAPAPEAAATQREQEEKEEEHPSFFSILLSHRSLVIHLA